MEGRIGTLHTHYRVVGRAPPTHHLDHLLQTQVGTALAYALGLALEDDSAVYVLRHVDVALTLDLRRTAPDAQIAQQWSQSLAVQLVHAIDQGESSDLIRFDTQADYVAQFVTDLLAGQAEDRWYYGAFAGVRGLGIGDALRVVLLENCAHVPDILARLGERGVLEAALAALDSAAQRAVWHIGICGGSAGPDPAALRPLFAAALTLLAALRGRDEAGSERLFRAYLDSDPPVPDWQRIASLTDGVIDALRFLAHAQPLLRSADLDLVRLVSALVPLDWLDRQRLAAAVLRLAADPATLTALPIEDDAPGWLRAARQQVADSATVPGWLTQPTTTPSLTPRQRALLDAIRALLAAGDVRLAAHDPQSAANALRLVAHLPAQWRADASTPAMIQQLLAGWAALAATGAPRDVLRRLRHAGAERAPSPALAHLTRLGSPALDVLETLVGTASPVRHGAAAIETACAGLFLLSRALRDLRLPLLITRSVDASASEEAALRAVLLAVGQRWAGMSPAVGEALDLGLALFAGSRDPQQADDLFPASDAAALIDPVRLQSALLHALTGQRLLDPASAASYRLALAPDRHAVLIGTEQAHLWPLGCLVAPDEADPTTALHTQWEMVTGSRPPELTASDDAHDALYAALAALLPEDTLLSNAIRTDADLTLSLLALAGLRAWARWLRQWASSSPGYLLTQFIRRPGQIAIQGDVLHVTMESRSLDVVLDMVGYTAPVERVAWLHNRTVTFQLGNG